MRFGVIGGAGKMGQLRIKSIQGNPTTSLAAVMDLSLDAAQKVANGAPAFTELEAFLATPMDAIVISTPPASHEDPCIAALQRGLHVLVEKPMAHTPRACQNMVAAAEKAGKTLATGFNMRFYPAFSYIKQVVDQNLIGEIDHVRVFGGHQGLANFGADWQYKAPASGGGAMWDVGIHMTDLARYILGEITSVYGVATNTVWNVPGSEDNALAILKSPSGVPAFYHATWNEWKGYKSAIEVYGSRGMVSGSYAPMENLLLTQPEPGGPVTKVKKSYLDVKIREKLKTWQSTALFSFADELNEFLRLADGHADAKNADGKAGLRAIEIAAAVAESSKTNSVITLPVL